MHTLREMFHYQTSNEIVAKVHEDEASPSDSSKASRDAELQAFEQLGTPAEVRDARPQIPPSEILDAVRATNTMRTVSTQEPPDMTPVERRHGFQGFRDSIAYRWQLMLLSAYGPAELTRQADPIEQLKRKYGRPPRKY